MRHQQILDKLAASRDLLQAMEQDLALWTCDVMSGSRGSDAAMRERLLPPIMARWRCLLDADDARTDTKNKAWVALATLLHKYGFLYEHITARALAAIDDLNKDVVLSDAFAWQAEAIKDFLQSAPTPRARRPRRPKSMTLLRVCDVVSIQLDGQFHAACVLDLHRDSGVLSL